MNKLKIKCLEFYSGFRSKSLYPEDLKDKFSQSIKKNRKLKIVIIDNDEFPFSDMLENMGCIVQCYTKYTKNTNQHGEGVKAINIGSPDVIFCDINDVGEEIYKEYKGLGIIENLREKLPFTAIYAYTANPGFVSAKLKNQTAIDGIYAKEWLTDDFLFNFERTKSIFFCPSDRWNFLRKRFQNIGASEKKIEDIRRAYVKNIIFLNLLSKDNSLNNKDILKIIGDSENKFDVAYLSKIGIKSAEIFTTLMPFIGD